MAGCCNLLCTRILCSCNCPCRSGHNVPINLQQNNCYFLFCNFLSLCEWKSVIPLKVKPGRQSIEIFQAIGNILLQRCRASVTKHRKQSTKVRAKGIDPIWSQVCSSPLQYQAQVGGPGPHHLKQVQERMRLLGCSLSIQLLRYSFS